MNPIERALAQAEVIIEANTGLENLSLRCLNEAPECRGKVELRMALSPSGKPFPRCDGHWAMRLDTQRGIEERYPVHQPADFDPSYAGESWDEEE